jgi:hypothetical protein
MFEVEQSFDPSEEVGLDLNIPSGDELNIIPLKITNKDGDSLKGAKLSLLSLDGSLISGTAKSSGAGEAQLYVKNATGPYTLRIQDIPNVPGGSWTTQIDEALESFIEAPVIEIPVERALKVEPGGTNEVSTMGELRATVIGLNGETQEPISGARVVMNRLSPGIEQTRFSSSDATGTATFEQLQPGLFMVTVIPQAGATFDLSTRAVWITPNNIESLELLARPRPRILGTVRKSHNEIANGYSVQTLGSFLFETLDGQEVLMLERTETDPAGAYSLFSSRGEQRMLILPPEDSGKPPGTASFTVEPQVGKASLEVNVTLPPPFIREIVFKRTDGSTIEDVQIELIWTDEKAPHGYIHLFGTSSRSGEWILALPGKTTSPEP